MKKIFNLFVCLLFAHAIFAAKDKQAFDIRLQNGLNMNVEVCSDGIFRVKISPCSTFSESLMERYGIIKTDWASVAVSPKEGKQQFEITTDNYCFKVNKKTGEISVSDKKGKVYIEKAVFVTSKDPLCKNLGEVINKKYESLKVATNGATIIGDNTHKGNLCCIKYSL